MDIPKTYDEFDVWVNEIKQFLAQRNFTNPLRHEWSVERCLLFHYQTPEEFFAGECTGYTSQSDGSVQVDIWNLGEDLTVGAAIRLVEVQYAKRTEYLTAIFATQ